MKYYLAIDVGGTSIKHAIINQEGNLLQEGKVGLPKTLEEFYQTVEEMIKETKKRYSIEGVALSMPGAVDSDSGFIGGASAVDYIHGPNIKEDIAARNNIKVSIENDANCAALAEVWLGSAKDVNDCIFIVSGTGIGGAIVKDRKIHKGNNLHGGEFGYMITSHSMEDGEFSTWSWDGSTVACLKKIADELGVDVSTLDGKEVFDQAETNPVYKKHVDNFYTVLAMGIFNLQYVYDPEKIVIGGAISARDDLISQVEKQLDRIFKKLTHANIRPTTVKCEYANSANVIGAVYHFIHS